LIDWLKESCRSFSRLEKFATNFGGMIERAFIPPIPTIDLGLEFSDRILDKSRAVAHHTK
jgi:hypothetical protein